MTWAAIPERSCPAPSANWEIVGELYELRDPRQQIPVLDKLEEFDPACPSKSQFLRRRVTVRLGAKRSVRAWMYCLPQRPPEAPTVPHGDYTKHLRRARRTP